ncbi:hypothetical protein DPMN_190252 [Dreissena polymorpha]|uniref:Uncharacterized protein n=1 Tax=Dreissena polymorpha TaxID=45954 RepID=A0A9D4DWG2_DREPO|nr:hypothetical protein DPMN_190252 [Dreissena polymorpha]
MTCLWTLYVSNKIQHTLEVVIGMSKCDRRIKNAENEFNQFQTKQSITRNPANPLMVSCSQKHGAACQFIPTLTTKNAQITGWTDTSFSSVTGTATATLSATVTSKVPENSIAVAKKTGSGAIVYIIASGNTGSLFEIDTAGAVNLATGKMISGCNIVATGKTLSQKTTENYTMVLLATESGAVADAGSTSLDHRGHMRVLCIGGDTGAHFGCGGGAWKGG